MASPTRANLQLLDYGFFGYPFNAFDIKDSNLETLDVGFFGEPFFIAIAALGATYEAETVETLTLTEEMLAYGTVNAPLISEMLTLTEAADRDKDRYGIASETLTFTDEAANTSPYPMSIDETLTLTDALDAYGAILASTDETITITDLMDAYGAILTTIDETLTLTDLMDGYGAIVCTVDESLTLTDEPSILTLFVIIAESLSIADFTVDAQNYTGKITETITLTDANARVYEVVRTTAETFTVYSRHTPGIMNVSIAESFWLHDLGLGDRPVIAKGKFPNLSGQHITLKIDDNSPMRLIDINLLMHVFTQLDQYAQVFPNLSGQHLTLKIQNNSASGSPFFIDINCLLHVFTQLDDHNQVFPNTSATHMTLKMENTSTTDDMNLMYVSMLLHGDIDLEGVTTAENV